MIALLDMSGKYKYNKFIFNKSNNLLLGKTVLIPRKFGDFFDR